MSFKFALASALAALALILAYGQPAVAAPAPVKAKVAQAPYAPPTDARPLSGLRIGCDGTANLGQAELVLKDWGFNGYEPAIAYESRRALYPGGSFVGITQAYGSTLSRCVSTGYIRVRVSQVSSIERRACRWWADISRNYQLVPPIQIDGCFWY